MSPLSEVEEDLRVIRQWQPRARRVYLTGANPFALSYNRLMDIAVLLRKYLPHMVSFGMFARVTDITKKSVEELKIAEFPEQELKKYRGRIWHL